MSGAGATRITSVPPNPFTARFGHGGAQVDRLRDELEELTGKPVLLNMLEDREHPQKRRKNAEAGHTAG